MWNWIVYRLNDGRGVIAKRVMEMPVFSFIWKCYNRPIFKDGQYYCKPGYTDHPMPFVPEYSGLK